MRLVAAILLQLGQPTGHVLTPLHFGVNVEFFRQYLAEGLTTQQAEFATALRESGVKALRFPGGNPAYYYLPENRERTMELAHAIKYWEFREDNPPSNRFVTLEQLAAFARQHRFQLIYELPCLFHLDGDTPRATIRSAFSERAGNYDGDRVTPGVEYGMRSVRRLRELGAPVAMWELGNEEFAHCAAADYAKVVSAYLRALQVEDPETPVTVVGMGKGWLDALVPLLRTAGTLDAVHSFQAHYPFGAWPGPGAGGARNDAVRFAMGDLRIEKWIEAHIRQQEACGVRNARVSVTETTVMRHKLWDPHAVIATQAHALCYAWNWIALLTDRRVDAAVFHDCGTPFFGLLRHHVGWHAETGQFQWLNSPKRPKALSPEFAARYVLSPTGIANRLLAELVGEELIEVRTAHTDAFRAIASRHRIVAVNRSPHAVALHLPGEVKSAEALVADSLSSCLPGEFGVKPIEVFAIEGDLRAVLPPHSVTALRRNSGDTTPQGQP